MSDLSAIVYRSRSVFAQTDLDLFQLLAHARKRNQTVGVTGVILYDRGNFFQWIEGTNRELGRVWSDIRDDSRHFDIRLLADRAIPMRLFDGWRMQLAHREHEHEGIAEGFVVADEALLDDLHLNPGGVPNILASFSRQGGGLETIDA